MITLWHNPRCSKSRQALALLEEAGAEVRIRRYLDDTPTEAELTTALAALDKPAIALVRTGEAAFKSLGLGKTSVDATLIRAMAENPILIERPLALKGPRAVLGRPPENVLALL